jgi:hypothetical protein
MMGKRVPNAVTTQSPVTGKLIVDHAFEAKFVDNAAGFGEVFGVSCVRSNASEGYIATAED